MDIELKNETDKPQTITTDRVITLAPGETVRIAQRHFAGVLHVRCTVRDCLVGPKCSAWCQRGHAGTIVGGAAKLTYVPVTEED